MHRCVTHLVSLAFATLAMISSAEACMMQAPIDLTDVKYADVVVVGRIENYTMVLDPIMRKRFPNRPPEQGFMSDYAKFDIHVDETLFGDAPKTITATWDNSTSAEPDSLPPGPFLIALRSAGKSPLPLRGPSATILPTPEPDLFTLLQAPCASPFLFPSNSDEAAAVRKILQP